MLLLAGLCFLQPFNFTNVLGIDPYVTLTLPKTFSRQQLNRAFKRFQELKTDLVDPSPRRLQDVKEIEFAFDILSNPSARKLYDLMGFDFLSYTDFRLTNYSSNIQMAVYQQTYGKVPIEMAESCGTIYFPLEFTLLDFYRGAQKDVFLSGVSACVCKKSKGKSCRKCRDNPFVEKILVHTVVLPPGAPSFYPILASDVYDHGVPRAPHDIVFLPMHAPDDLFERRGNDLWTTHTLTLAEVVRGKSVEVTSIDGATVNVDWSSAFQTRSEVRIPGKGFPYGKEGEAGDLVVQFDIEFPVKLNEQQAKALGDLLPVSENDYD
jgi:curved DNA-binding protein